MFVQTKDGAADLDGIAASIADYRETLRVSANLKGTALLAAAYSGEPIKAQSARSYTFVVFRYYEASGMFRKARHGKEGVLRISGDPGQAAKAARIAANAAPNSALTDPLSYLSRLESGAFA